MPAEATADSSLTVSELQLRVEELGGQLRSQREEYLEALQREAAVAEIMRVINEPSADLSRVFSVMIERATQLCSASYGYVWLYDGERVHAVAASAQQTFGDWLRDSEARVPAEQSPLGQVLLNHRLVHVVDATEDEAYKTHLPFRELVDRGGVRTLLHVPLRKGNELLGVITVFRQERQPFSDRQIALLESFAAQAVIALENARLLSELRERTRELTTSFEYQAATSTVLNIISRSPTDTQPVFDAIAESTARLCEAEFCTVYRFDGEFMHFMASYGVSTAVREDFQRAYPMRPGRGSCAARAILSGKVEQIPDVHADSDHRQGHAADAMKINSVVAAPMLKEGRPVGAIALSRAAKGAFPQRQIELLQTFADQAVIAINNVSLFNEVQAHARELQESLNYQTATSEVLKVISRSTFDLQPVLQTLAETALRLCEADMCFVMQREGELYRATAVAGVTQEVRTQARNFLGYLEQHPLPPGRDSLTGRVALERQAVQITDCATDPEYTLKEATTLANLRTQLGVPLLREGVMIGIVIVSRQRVEPFTKRQIGLAGTFADQAVIAIENTRLLTEQREALEQQTATAEVLQVINSSPGNLTPVFETILEKAHMLCASVGSLLLYDGEKFRAVAVHSLPEPMERQLREGYAPGPNHPSQQLLAGKDYVHVRDMAEIDDPIARLTVEVGKLRTLLYVALRKDSKLVGQIVANRTEVRPFSDKEISLLRSFAAQAVIAIENARLVTEQREALEQQTATAEVLQVINTSPGNLAPVFASMLEKALRLCEAAFGVFWTYDGERFRASASLGLPDAFAELVNSGPHLPGANNALAMAVRGQSTIHMEDAAASDAYRSGDPLRRAMVDLGGARSTLGVALRKDDVLLGVFILYRQEVRPFSDRQIALLQNFAAQAVIAMENARLLTEQREALERQTATAEVLGVINSSPGNLKPVFDTMLERAVRLSEAAFGLMNVYENGEYRNVALHGFSGGLIEQWPQPGPQNPLTRIVNGEDVVHIEDMTTYASYVEGDARTRAFVDIGGARSLLVVALRKDSVLLGSISVFRREVRPFSQTQIQLLQGFAAQAVIAMENGRLLDELRQRTSELARSVDELTATSDVLKIISRSSVDLETVLDTLVDRIVRLCRADHAQMFRLRDDRFVLAASRGLSDEAMAFIAAHPIEPHRGTLSGRVALERRPIHIVDVLEDPDYTYREGQAIAGFRTMLGIPLLREDALIGIFIVNRTHVEPFTDKEIELATTFTDQAVIAIENARLFEELSDRQAELRVTFDNMGGGVAMFDADLRLAAWNRNFQEIIGLSDDWLARRPTYADYLRLLAERGEFTTENVEGFLEDTDKELRRERTRPDGTVIEARRNAVPGGGFVLIYIDITERKRSEEKVRAARDVAETALKELKTAQASLIHAEKMASLGQLTAGIAHEIKNPLNFINNFAGLSVELLDELKTAVMEAAAEPSDERRREIDERIELLTSNLEKITSHGRRADGIVKSMLAHSRGGSGERRSADINAVLEEALNLAYHGARAQDQSFNVTLDRDLESDIAPIEIVPQDVTRVFLNLIGNGFYAVTKRRRQQGDAFRPTLKVTTRDLPDAVQILIRDNGVGIPPQYRQRLFQPFFTTKPTGEGTGLGLSISYDIVTQQHGGTITVDSEPGRFSEFTIRLPRHRQAAAAAGRPA